MVGEVFGLLIGFCVVPGRELSVEIGLNSTKGSGIKSREVSSSSCRVGERVDLRVERVDTGVFTAGDLVGFVDSSDVAQLSLPRCQSSGWNLGIDGQLLLSCSLHVKCVFSIGEQVSCPCGSGNRDGLGCSLVFCANVVDFDFVILAFVFCAHRGDVAADDCLVVVNDGLKVPVSAPGKGGGGGHAVVATIIVCHGTLEVQGRVLGASGLGDITSVVVVVDDSVVVVVDDYVFVIVKKLVQSSAGVIGLIFPLEALVVFNARGVLLENDLLTKDVIFWNSILIIEPLGHIDLNDGLVGQLDTIGAEDGFAKDVDPRFVERGASAVSDVCVSLSGENRQCNFNSHVLLEGRC